MNIDYEAIEKDIRTSGGWAISLHAIKAIIEAYEAQKAPPEWVPLDLATVKQGQEVRHQDWSEDGQPTEFVCTYRGAFVTAYMGAGLTIRSRNVDGWLMRAPKQKTVRVFVFKRGAEYAATTNGQDLAGIVGEGDVEVKA